MRGSLLLFFGLCLTTGWLVPDIGASAKPPAVSRTVLSNLPEKAIFNAVALDGKIYAFRYGPGGDSAAYVYDPRAVRWTARAASPLKRTGAGVVEAGGRVFVIGGFTAPNAPTGALEEYDPARDAWTRKTDMPTARGRTGTVVLDGKIYVLGGLAQDGAHTAALEAYDLATGAWSRLRDLSQPLMGVNAVAARGKIYKLKGTEIRNGRWNFIMDFEEYDPAGDEWSKKAPWIFEREPLEMAVADGRLFVFGAGAYTDSCAHSLMEYDFDADRWIIRSDMPAANAHTIHPSWTVLGGRIYTFGGGFRVPGGWKRSSHAQRYDPRRDAWEELPPLDQGKLYMPAVALGGSIFVLGGDTTPGPDDTRNQTFSGTVVVYTPKAGA